MKIESYVLVARTKSFLSDVRELRNMYPICVFKTMINNCAVKCYERTNLIREMIFLRSLILLRNGFVLATNIWISIFAGIRNEHSRFHIKLAVKGSL